MTKPRVFSCFPSNGTCSTGAMMSHAYLPSKGKCEIIPGFSESSMLPHGFNCLWATALNYFRAGAIDYWLLHHADIQICTHGWLDIMVEEMERTPANILSVVVPIKDDSGNTSTAVDTDDVWRPRKLTLQECHSYPPTFAIEDTQWPESRLLVNSGVMLLKLDCPEWLTMGKPFFDADDGWYPSPFAFGFETRVTKQPDGQFAAEIQSEDWLLSRQAAGAGLKVMATTKIEVIHQGMRGHSNQLAQEMVRV